MQNILNSLHGLLTSVTFLVDGCLPRAHNPGILIYHFMYRHWNYQIAILQEGPTPLPRRNQCEMHMPAPRSEKHKKMAMCYRAIGMQLQCRYVKLVHICVEM